MDLLLDGFIESGYTFNDCLMLISDKNADSILGKKFKIENEDGGAGEGAVKQYMDLIVGKRSYLRLIAFEFITLFCSWVPGALGLALRKTFYPKLLGSCGHGVIFGPNVTLRYPHKISIGDNVVIDENVMLDAKGKKGGGITIADDVFIGRNAIISNKDGTIRIDERSNLGFNCIVSATSSVNIGKDCIFAAYTYVIGGGSYYTDGVSGPMAQNYDYEGKGGVVIGDDVWLGARVMVMDGVTVEDGAVVAAGAVVTKDCPGRSISIGVPARVSRMRR